MRVLSSNGAQNLKSILSSDTVGFENSLIGRRLSLIWNAAVVQDTQNKEIKLILKPLKLNCMLLYNDIYCLCVEFPIPQFFKYHCSICRILSNKWLRFCINMLLEDIFNSLFWNLFWYILPLLVSPPFIWSIKFDTETIQRWKINKRTWRNSSSQYWF